MNHPIPILTGPTACGKTTLAVELGRRFPIEVVSADSLQVFRHLDIGTAKPTSHEREAVRHHVIDVLNPDQEASAAWYASKAADAIRDIAGRNRIPLIVGGSGFYLRALEKPPIAMGTPAHALPDLPENAHPRLNELDPEAAEKIHANDRYRLSRALALLEKGIKPSEHWKAAASQPPAFEFLWIGIEMDREELYSRIDRRLTEMFSDGLIEETEKVRLQFPEAEKRLRRTLGYRQAIEVLEGRPATEALAEAQQESRNYAKRQLTWFRADKRIQWRAPADALDYLSREIERASHV